MRNGIAPLFGSEEMNSSSFGSFTVDRENLSRDRHCLQSEIEMLVLTKQHLRERIKQSHIGRVRLGELCHLKFSALEPISEQNALSTLNLLSELSTVLSEISGFRTEITSLEAQIRGEVTLQSLYPDLEIEDFSDLKPVPIKFEPEDIVKQNNYPLHRLSVVQSQLSSHPVATDLEFPAAAEMATALSVKWKVEDVGCAKLRGIIQELTALCNAEEAKVCEKEAELEDLRKDRLRKELELAKKCAEKKAVNDQKFTVMKETIRKLNSQRTHLRKALVFCERQCEQLRRELAMLTMNESFADVIDLVKDEPNECDPFEEKSRLTREVDILRTAFWEALKECDQDMFGEAQRLLETALSVVQPMTLNDDSDSDYR
jgi:hypothetical protein